MAAYAACTGAVHVFVGFGGGPGGSRFSATGGGPAYLGTGEKAPYWRMRPAYAPLFTDVGGVMLPFTNIYSGHEAFVTVRLTRWNYGTLRKVEALSDSGDPGNDPAGSVGTLPSLEGNIKMHLWLTFPYAGDNPGMPKGIHFHAAELTELGHQPGTGTNSYDVSWHCQREYDPGSGEFTVYDEDLGGLPPPE